MKTYKVWERGATLDGFEPSPMEGGSAEHVAIEFVRYSEVGQLDSWPVGASNDEWVKEAKYRATQIVCAWGSLHPKLRRRTSNVLRALHGRELFCLGTNKDGSPKHPLYLPAVAKPIHWDIPREIDNEDETV